MKRTPKNALLAVLGIYGTIALFVLVIGGKPSANAALLAVIPALLGGLVLSGYLTIIRTQDGIRFVDARRSPQSMQKAAQSRMSPVDHSPTVNVNGLPMLNGVDSNGNPFGSTLNDPKPFE